MDFYAALMRLGHLNLWAGYSAHYWAEPAEGVMHLHQICLWEVLNIKQSNDLFFIIWRLLDYHRPSYTLYYISLVYTI